MNFLAKKKLENIIFHPNRKKKGWEATTVSAKRFQIYNFPTSEDIKLYHEPRFRYRHCIKNEIKRERKRGNYAQTKDSNAFTRFGYSPYNVLIDECDDTSNACTEYAKQTDKTLINSSNGNNTCGLRSENKSNFLIVCKNAETNLCFKNSVLNKNEELNEETFPLKQEDIDMFLAAICLIFTFLDTINKIKNMSYDFSHLDSSPFQEFLETPKKNQLVNLTNFETPLKAIDPNLILSQTNSKQSEKRKITTIVENDENEDSRQSPSANTSDKSSAPNVTNLSPLASGNRKSNNKKMKTQKEMTTNFVSLTVKTNSNKFTADVPMDTDKTTVPHDNEDAIHIESNKNSTVGQNAAPKILNECPVYDEKDVESRQRSSQKPKVITRGDYSRSKEQVKPKTICYALSDSQIRFLSSVNVVDFITQTAKINLDLSGNSRGYTIIGQKLFVYTATQDDFEKLVKNNNWPLHRNQFVTLEHKSSTVILRGISVDEIEQHTEIAEDLKFMGVIGWTPLIEGQNDHMGVKCEVGDKAHLTEILRRCYVEGKRYKLGNGKSANVRFDPDTPNPNQCYKCFKFFFIISQPLVRVSTTFAGTAERKNISPTIGTVIECRNASTVHLIQGIHT